MKEDKKIEQILMNDEKYEEFIHSKTEQEFKKILESKNKIEIITDIKKVPKSLLFSKKATYSIINKDSKTMSYINGVQAEAFLSADNISREKIISGQMDSFVCENNYIKFVKVKV